MFGRSPSPDQMEALSDTPHIVYFLTRLIDLRAAVCPPPTLTDNSDVEPGNSDVESEEPTIPTSPQTTKGGAQEIETAVVQRGLEES